MEELTTQFGAGAAMLVGLIAGIVQQFKRSPAIEKLQEKFPVYQILSLGLGVLGAMQFALPNPIFAGLFIGAASMGAFDTVKKVKLPANVAKILIITALPLLLFAGCAEPIQPKVWLLSGSQPDNMDSNIEYLGRVGIGDKTEIGLTANWWEQDPHQSYGLYALRYLPTDPNSMLGNPYAGAHSTLYVSENRGGMYGFFAGTIQNIGGIDLVTEYQYRVVGEAIASQTGKKDDQRIFIGGAFKF